MRAQHRVEAAVDDPEGARRVERVAAAASAGAFSSIVALAPACTAAWAAQKPALPPPTTSTWVRGYSASSRGMTRMIGTSSPARVSG